MSNYTRLLRNHPDFARLWMAQVISLLGDWFLTIVLSAQVAKFSNGSGLAVSLFLLARFLPPLLAGPFTGVLIDRFDRKRLLILSDVSRTVVVLLLLIALRPETLWLVYLLTMIQFLISSIFDPGRNAIIPSLLPRDQLVIGNTLGSVTWSVMLAVGAIVGGVVAALLGTQAAIIIDAVTFAISALLILQIKMHPEYLAGSEMENPTGERSEQGFIDGLRYVRKHPATLAALLVKTGQSLGNVDALMVIYASELFIMGSDSTTPLSIMYAAFGFGAVIGPLLLNRFNDGSIRVMRRLIIIGFVWIALGWFAMGGAATLVLVSAALVLRAMGGSVNWTYSSIIIQKSVADRFLGRMFSLDMVGFQLASAISILATGVLVDAVGAENVREVVGLMGAISLIPLLIWVVVVPRLERRETPQEPAPSPAGD
ncbi:MAG: MFS transporter [Anaerolineae bacterium]|nr:MFS transporter [Anaerolineae bacterium]